MEPLGMPLNLSLGMDLGSGDSPAWGQATTGSVNFGAVPSAWGTVQKAMPYVFAAGLIYLVLKKGR